MEDRAQKIIDRSVDRLNDLLSYTTPVPKESDTILLGPGGMLDSMGYINFLVALEEELESQFGIKVVLADLVTASEGPTIGDLYQVLTRIIKDNNCGELSLG